VYSPTAVELLNSGLLPAEAGHDNSVEGMLLTLANPHSAAYARLMNALFSKKRNGTFDPLLNQFQTTITTIFIINITNKTKQPNK
jgi:hypothetical protein